MAMNTFMWISIICFIFALATTKNRTRKRTSIILGAFFIFIYSVISGFYIVSDYFTGEGINDAVIYHLLYGLEGSGFGDYYLIIMIGFGFFLFSFIASYFYYRLLTNAFFDEPKRFRQILSTLLFFLSFVFHPTLVTFYDDFSREIGLTEDLSVQNNFADYYKTPKIQSTSDEHLNLVYIFAESFETTYFDENLFPNLVPHLRELKEQSTFFTDIRQVKGTSWTIAGATATICGLPLVTPSSSSTSSQGNSMSKMNSFYSGATCMSDLLHKEGYKFVSRRGASLKFAGTDKLYKTHNFSDIKGLDELKSGLKNPHYLTSWGLYDDTLFDISLNEFKKLSSSKQKFALFLSTMDTHHPNGHVSKSCQNNRYKDGRNSMLNSMYCSDELIYKFIKQIQSSPYGKNTIIVVASDHLAMHNLVIETLNKGERKNQLMILDPRIKEGTKVSKTGSTLDISTTLLPFLGYQADVGLGRNLLGNEPSLISTFEDFDDQIDAWTKDISQFWQFPKIEKDIVLDGTKKGVKIGNSFYAFPILLRLNESLEVNPFFEVTIKQFNTPRLYNFLSDFQPNDTFIWVDKCPRIDLLMDDANTSIPQKGKWCIAYGKLGSSITSEALSKTTLTPTNLLQLTEKKSLDENATKIREKLKQYKEK